MEIVLNTINREIVNTRIFDVPHYVLFEAWSHPEHLAAWWGPKGFTNTFHEFDFKSGGIWKFTMHGPDGIDYQNKSVFEEITKPEKIVFTHLKPMHKFRVTATFDALGPQTKLIFRMLFESVEECERVKLFVIDANEENFDKLEEYIQKNLK